MKLIIGFLAVVPLFLLIGFLGGYIFPWFKIKKTFKELTFKEYFKIRTLLKDDADLMVSAYAQLVNNGISDASLNDMMKIHLYGGNIELVVSRLIAARKKNVQGSLIEIALLEFEERGFNEEAMQNIRKYLETE